MKNNNLEQARLLAELRLKEEKTGINVTQQIREIHRKELGTQRKKRAGQLQYDRPVKTVPKFSRTKARERLREYDQNQTI